jgi:hypothetical protein
VVWAVEDRVTPTDHDHSLADRLKADLVDRGQEHAGRFGPAGNRLAGPIGEFVAGSARVLAGFRTEAAWSAAG